MSHPSRLVKTPAAVHPLPSEKARNHEPNLPPGGMVADVYLVPRGVQYRSQVIGAARGNPSLQLLAQFRARRQISLLNFHFQEVPPIANGTLDGHLSSLLHGTVLRLESIVHRRKLKALRSRRPIKERPSTLTFCYPLSTFGYQLFFLSSSTTSASITSPSPWGLPLASPSVGP